MSFPPRPSRSKDGKELVQCPTPGCDGGGHATVVGVGVGTVWHQHHLLHRHMGQEPGGSAPETPGRVTIYNIFTLSTQYLVTIYKRIYR